jgi:hypothetical protein
MAKTTQHTKAAQPAKSKPQPPQKSKSKGKAYGGSYGGGSLVRGPF